MKLALERDTAEALATAFPDGCNYQSQLDIGGRAEVTPQELSSQQLLYLRDLYLGKSDAKSALYAALAQVADTAAHEPEDLESLLLALIDYLLNDGERGWLFYPDGGGALLPYLVSRIDYTGANGEDQARIMIELKANSRAKLASNQIIIGERDLSAGVSAAQILRDKGYLKETPALLAQYDASNSLYQQWRSLDGEQFSGRGTGIYAEDPNANKRQTDWSQKTRVVLSTHSAPANLVNDEGIISQRDLTLSTGGDLLRPLLKKIDRNSPFKAGTEDAINAWQEKELTQAFNTIPIHGFIFMYHLNLHHHVWVHVNNLAPYEYQPALKDKLVLPQEHVELIDILTADMALLTDDIVAGKSGGTTVLCSGPPGVGKTLTAEVYAEIIHRPLYRVHSGQLGLNVAEMESNLKSVLIRAQRWGAVMLIDEADVYIKRRDDNLTMNAVVGVFLRVLEYFNGLLFMTTNRLDDIDEAIISRCIAMVRYHAPNVDERTRIWQVMAQQFGLTLDDALISELARCFATASGRDIKGLAKLVARFSNYRSQPATLEMFKHCAKFRALDCID